MSSAILYLAIVGIWAVVLVPRWLRPSQASGTLESHLAEPLDASIQEDLAEEDGEEAFADADAEVAAAAPVRSAGSVRSPGLPRSAAHTRPATARAADTGPAGRESPVSPGRRQQADDRPGPLAAKRRAGIVRARRLTLTSLIVLTAAAVGVVMAHLAASWVVIPPAVMLAGCVLMLRAAARIDVQRTRAAASRPARGTGASVPAQADSVPAQAADVPAQAGAPDAKIIDISARVGDQLYDQYADVRAVGD